MRPPRLVLDWRLPQSRGMVPPHACLPLDLDMEDSVQRQREAHRTRRSYSLYLRKSNPASYVPPTA